ATPLWKSKLCSKPLIVNLNLPLMLSSERSRESTAIMAILPFAVRFSFTKKLSMRWYCPHVLKGSNKSRQMKWSGFSITLILYKYTKNRLKRLSISRIIAGFQDHAGQIWFSKYCLSKFLRLYMNGLGDRRAIILKKYLHRTINSISLQHQNKQGHCLKVAVMRS